ncbi:hypothetical protein HYU10_05255 [Candidatus Woesearchaeota archaeon]|nr:hypothetical protein [Candidatus Woesearchaeota archaeon]
MDTKKFGLIKEECEEYYNSFLRQGKFPLGPTEKGFWGAAVPEEILELFNNISIKKYRNFVDLGSGDGKVVLIASLFGIHAVGIEFDGDLFRKSVEIRDNLDLKCSFMNSDFYGADLSGFSLIFVNPDAPFERGLEKKLLKEMKGKLIVYGEQFKPKRLKHEEQFFIGGTEINIYSNKKP